MSGYDRSVPAGHFATGFNQSFAARPLALTLSADIALSKMDGQTKCCTGCFVNSLAESGMRVNSCFDLFKGGFEGDREAKLGDQFGRFCSNNMCAEDYHEGRVQPDCVEGHQA